MFTNLDRYGNTSAASVPIALCEAIEQGKVKTQDKIVMVGFGAGLSWGAAVIQWGVVMPYKRRQWWYRSLRWMLYRWVEIRSGFVRWRRRMGTRLGEDQDGYMPLETPEKPATPKREEVPRDKGRSTNGSSPQPKKIDQPAKEKPPAPKG